MTTLQSVGPDGVIAHQERDFRKLAVLTVAAISAVLALYNIDFPFGIHPDESIKVSFAIGGADNYLHPPLMIILARFVVWISRASGQHDVLLAGRSVSALACVGASVLFYLVLRRYADGLNAFLWSCVFAASPAIAVHAHYFKEDAVLVLAICVGLHALMRLKEHQGIWTLIYFGFALGLAITAKYVGAANSLVLLLVAISWLGLGLRQGTIIVAACALTVLAIFMVSFSTEAGNGFSTVINGLTAELSHAETGHDLKEWFWEGYGLTHFRYHLVPSITLPSLVIALGVICTAILADRSRPVAAYAGAAFFWLLFLEASPLKIVGSMRYVLPVVIYLLLAAGIACSRAIAPRSRLIAAGLGIIAVVASGHAGVAYVANMGRQEDTRFAAMRFLEAQDIKRFVVDYPMGEPAPMTLKYRELASVDYLVSVRFQRYLRGGGLTDQDPEIYAWAGMFRCLDSHVVTQFSKSYGDYGYVAPTIRIYDLRDARSCLPEAEPAPPPPL